MGLKANHDITIRKFNPLTEDINAYSKSLMRLEKEFQEDIRETWPDKKELILSSTLCFFAFKDNQVIAELYLVDHTYKEDGEDSDSRHLNKVMDLCQVNNALYIYSAATLSEHANKDISKRLLIQAIMEAKLMGYDKLYSHSKEGSSSHLSRFFEAKSLGKRSNWFDTGNTHYLFEFDLTSLNFAAISPFKQQFDYDCGLAAIACLLDNQGISVDDIPTELCHEGEGTEPDDMISIVNHYGFKARVFNKEEIIYHSLPCILLTLCPGTYEGHYLVAMGYGLNSLYVMDPDTGKIGRMSIDELRRVWWNNIDKIKWALSISKEDN